MCHNNPTTDSTFPIDKNNKEYIWAYFSFFFDFVSHIIKFIYDPPFLFFPGL